MEQVDGGGRLDVLGQQHDRRCRAVCADLPCGVDAVVSVVGWHPDIGDDQVGGVAACRAEEVGCRVDGCEDLVAVIGEDPCHALAEQDGVVGDYDAQGSSAMRLVPPRVGLSTRNDPPCAWTRSAR